MPLPSLATQMTRRVVAPDDGADGKLQWMVLDDTYGGYRDVFPAAPAQYATVSMVAGDPGLYVGGGGAVSPTRIEVALSFLRC